MRRWAPGGLRTLTAGLLEGAGRWLVGHGRPVGRWACLGRDSRWLDVG